MDISIVILTFNSEKYIERCISDLIESMEILRYDYEAFIIDNGSKDNTINLIEPFMERSGGRIKLVKLSTNTGTTYSRNKGLNEASGKYIIIMDSDAYVNAGAIKKLCSHLDSNKQCGMAVPGITYPDGRFQLSTDTFPTFQRKFMRFFFLKKMEKKETLETEKKIPIKVDYAISAFWMLPKSTLDKVGVLDEKIFYSPEDVDYCIRVWKAGLYIDYLPEVAIIHDAQEISRPKGFRLSFFTLLHIKGLFYLFWKHKYFLYPEKFRQGKGN